MKTLKIVWLVLFSFLFFNIGKAQNETEDKLGLPGDNLNLFAVLKLFQESETLEGFEKNLNLEDTKINNLDLNGDNLIDYIKVIDYPEGENHTIILQVPVSQTENQDVAVFTVQKDSKGEVQVQLVGDEALYGKDYIIEPNYDDNASATSTPNPGYAQKKQSNARKNIVNRTTYVEVASWPVVRYIYLPSYAVWNSPWYWGYYPSLWQPWKPYYWHYYYGYHYNNYNWYHGHYRHCNHYRYNNWNSAYYSTRRNQSAYYGQRKQNGDFNNTYSRPESRREGSAAYNKRNPDSRNGARNNTMNRQGERPQNNNAVRNRNGNVQNDTRGVNRNPSGREGVRGTEKPRTKVQSGSRQQPRNSGVDRKTNRSTNQARPSVNRQNSGSSNQGNKSSSRSNSSGSSRRK